jgi:hypothetical protein
VVTLILALALGACGGDEVEVLDPYPSALAAYDAGVAALEAGDPERAVVALTQAVAADPRSPELPLWLGRAHAARGDYGSAVEAASAALMLQPSWGLARYNRACWRVRGGDLAAGYTDLVAALATNEVGVLQAGSDPDLAPLRADPRFSDRVPAATLPVLLEAGPESVFLSSDWTVTLLVAHPSGETPGVRWDGPAPPGLALRRVVQDRTVQRAEVRTSIAWTWRVTGPYEGPVGPLHATTGSLSGQTTALEARHLAPPGTPVATGGPPALVLSSVLFADLGDGVPVRQGERVRVRVAAGDRVAWSPRPPGLVRHELREDGQATWIGWDAAAPPSTVVTVRRGRKVLFEGVVP